jgi:hypothetical protein
MFVETITSPKEAWDDWIEKLKLHSDPPSALVASIAWSSDDGMVTQVNVWDAPGAVSDFYMKRVLPLVQAEGEPEHKPKRHGEPLAVYVRQ